MLKKIAIICALLLASPAFGAISIVNNDSNHGYVGCGVGSSNCMTPLINTTGATLYVADISSYSTGYGSIRTLVAGFTNNGNSIDPWTCPSTAQSHDSAGNYHSTCYAPGPAPSPWVTFQCNGNYVACSVSIWTGTDPSSAVLTASSAAASSSAVTTLSPGSVATSPGDLIITGWGSNTTTLGCNLGSTPTGYTQLYQYCSTASELVASAYIINGSSPQNPAWTVASSTKDMSATILVFKPMSGTPIWRKTFASGYTFTSAASTNTLPDPVVAGNYEVCGLLTDVGLSPSAANSIADNSSPPNTLAEITSARVQYYDTAQATYQLGSIFSGPIVTSNTAAIWTATFASSSYKGYLLCVQYVNLASSPIDTASVVTAYSSTNVQTLSTPPFNTAAANEIVFTFVASAIGGKNTFAPIGSLVDRGLDCNTGATPGTPPPSDCEQTEQAADLFTGSLMSGVTTGFTWTVGYGNNVVSPALIMSVGFEGLSSSPAQTLRRTFSFQ
jgi:hypothetical protein